MLYGKGAGGVLFIGICAMRCMQEIEYLPAGPFIVLAKCMASVASGSKNLDLMASVKVRARCHPCPLLRTPSSAPFYFPFDRIHLLFFTAVKVLVMMPFCMLLWLGSTVAFCVTVA